MRVLWIAQNGGLYKNNEIKGTGGWIASLQKELARAISSLELGVLFPHKTDCMIVEEGKVTYIPFTLGEYNNKFLRVIKRRFQIEETLEKIYVENILNAIKYYNPDVVHIWGLEQYHSAAIPFINKPCVVHIQGLTSFYQYTYCTPFFSEEDIKKCDNFIERVLFHHGQWANYMEFKTRAKRELRYAPYVKNWIGRTDWDRQAASMLSPGSNYFHCEEIMRNDFNNVQWNYHYKDVLHIQSNISCDWYKGVDVVLKTAEILKRQGEHFEWNIYGIDGNSKMVKYMTRKLCIRPEDVNVYFWGRVTGEVICDSLLKADVYCHPAYIENSSNAIAEAMLIGVPTIAQYVGGNPSMIKDDSGILVASNEPYILAYNLIKMKDKNLADWYSQSASRVAKDRQDSNKIVKTLMNIYESLLKSE